MNWFERIIWTLSWRFTDEQGNEYCGIEPYGAFHLVFFAVSVVVGIMMCIFLRDVREKTMRVILLSAGAVLLLLEGYKQLACSFNGTSWSYSWYNFPFQFCATPMYAMVIAGALPDCKVRRGLISYLSTFSLIAGLCVMIFVGEVFQTSILGVCIQTMVHHGAMIAIGFWLIAWNRKSADVRGWAYGVLVFVCFEAIALTLNAVINGALGEGTVDFYYLSPTPTNAYIPVFGFIRNNTPFPVYLLIYNVGFALGSFCFYELTRFMIKTFPEKKPDTMGL